MTEETGTRTGRWQWLLVVIPGGLIALAAWRALHHGGH